MRRSQRLAVQVDLWSKVVGGAVLRLALVVAAVRLSMTAPDLETLRDVGELCLWAGAGTAACRLSPRH